MQKRKMPRDPNQRAFETLRMAMGETDDTPPVKDLDRVERGKLGGSKGGKLRAERLSPERRAEIATGRPQRRAGARTSPSR